MGDYDAPHEELEANSDNPAEESTDIAGAVSDLTTNVRYLFPDLKGMTSTEMAHLLKERSKHYIFLYFAATVALGITTGMVTHLNQNQVIPVRVDHVTPPGTIVTFSDFFATSSTIAGPGLPPTVLLCVWAGLELAYYVLRYWYLPRLPAMVTRSEDGWRWVFLSACKGLMWIIIAALNGQAELFQMILIGALTVSVCAQLYNLDRTAHMATKPADKTKPGEALGSKEGVWNAILGVAGVVAITATAFIVIFAYNGKDAMPHWVFVLSIVMVVWETFVIAVWLGYTHRGNVNVEIHRREFVRGQVWFDAVNFANFAVIAGTVFGMMSKTVP